VDINLSIQD